MEKASKIIASVLAAAAICIASVTTVFATGDSAYCVEIIK